MSLTEIHLTFYDFFNSPLFVIPFFMTLLCFLANIMSIVKKDQKLKDESFLILYATHSVGMFSYIPLKIKRIIHSFLLLFMGIACLLSIKPFVINTLGCNDINVMLDGTYCYYVEATNEKGKTYTTPARVYVGESEYQIDEIFFTNGESVSFQYCSIDREDGLYYAEAEEQGNNKEWKLKLLNKKAYCSEVEETIPKATVIDYMLILTIISSFYLALAHLIEICKTEGVE